MNDLRDLLIHEIEDLYSAEEQIIAALPLMIENASNKNLKDSLKQHLKVTQEQKKRLDKVQKMLGEGGESSGKNKGFLAGLFGGHHVCKGMKGIIDEGNKIMAEDMNPDVKDAAIIASAQKVEHYEICGYGTARSFAEELNLPQIAKLLEETLNEEYEADVLLTELAVNRINQEAEVAGSAGTGSGSGRSNGEARGGSGERVRQEETEMEMAGSRRSENSGSEKKSASSRTGGQPKSSDSSPRSNSSGRSTASAKKSASASRNSKSGSGSSSNGRSSSGGRSSGSSTGRGRK